MGQVFGPCTHLEDWKKFLASYQLQLLHKLWSELEDERVSLSLQLFQIRIRQIFLKIELLLEMTISIEEWKITCNAFFILMVNSNDNVIICLCFY